MSLMLKSPDGTPSTTRTAFFLGCMVCISKLAFSGMDLHFLKVPVFGGSDFGIAIAALGGIYSLDKHIVNLGNKDSKEG